MSPRRPLSSFALAVSASALFLSPRAFAQSARANAATATPTAQDTGPTGAPSAPMKKSCVSICFDTVDGAPPLVHVVPPSTPTQAAAPREPSPHAAPQSESSELTDQGEVDHWYGGELIAIDAVALGLGLGGVAIAASDTSHHDYDSAIRGMAVGLLGAAVYVVGAPIAHAVHGQGGRAVASAGLRVGLPAVLGGAGGGGGAALGVLGAMVLDDGLLAHERVKRAPRISLTPTVDLVHRGGGLSAVGTF